MDFLALTIENRQMQSMVAYMEQDIHCLNAKVQDLEKKKTKCLEEKLDESRRFGVESIFAKEDKMNGLFKYYTTITYIRFLSLLPGIFFTSTKLFP